MQINYHAHVRYSSSLEHFAGRAELKFPLQPTNQNYMDAALI
jgi:hypothetical protein